MRVLVTTDRDPGGGFAEGPRVRPRRPSVRLGESLIEALRGVGAIPLLLPPGEVDLEGALDGVGAVVISGGDFDIHPRHFGEAPHPRLGRVDDKRTDTELALARLCVERDVAVLGICGGMQALAVATGGSLWQDLPSQLPEAGPHVQDSDPAEGWHALRVEPGLLRAVLGAAPVVNSTHHQAVREAGACRVTAWAQDGVVEGIELANHRFCVGVQWHPELLPAQRGLFASLVGAS